VFKGGIELLSEPIKIFVGVLIELQVIYNSILYLAVATKDTSGKIIQCSSTLAIEG